MFWFKLIFGILFTILLLAGMIGLRFGMAMDKFKIKRKYVVIFLMTIAVLGICTTVWSVLFHPSALFLVIAGLVGMGIDTIFLLAVLKDKHNFNQYLICSVVSVLIIPCCWNMMITQFNAYNHTIVYDYEISIVDNEIVAEYDENLPGIEKIVDEAIENMKKYGSTYYKGSVEVNYKCMYPPFKNLHEPNCICTDREICYACEDYAFREGTVQEVNSN